MVKIKKQVKRKNPMKVLKVIDLIKPIETGTNPPTDNERTKRKIVKGIHPFYN